MDSKSKTTPTSVLRSLKRRFRPLLWRWPFIHSRLLRALHGGNWKIRADWDFWVAGFPRSGNTFAGVLLEETGNFGRVSYHCHMAGRVVELNDAGIPGIIVLRRPDDSVLSWAIYNDWTLERALGDYIDFHKFLLPQITSLNVASFDWFTKHPQELISAAATLRSSEFDDFEFSDGFLERVNAKIESLWRNGDGIVNEQRVARPSQARMEKKNILLNEIHSNQNLSNMLTEATEVYGQFLSRSKGFSIKARPDNPACAASSRAAVVG